MEALTVVQHAIVGWRHGEETRNEARRAQEGRAEMLLESHHIKAVCA